MLVALVLLLPAPGVAQFTAAPYDEEPQPDSKYAAAVEGARELIRAFMEARGAPGLSIAVGVGDRVVWSEGFGYANVEHRIPVTTLTKFRSGSVSKTVAQAAASRLYEEGKLDFKAPVQRYVPSFPKRGHEITAWHLATHTSGIRHWLVRPEVAVDGLLADSAGEEFFNTRRYTNLVDALHAFQDDPLLFEPGTKFSYTSNGANLLGAVVQGAAGQDYLTVLRTYVFEPVGMRNTVGEQQDKIISNRASYYQRTGLEPTHHARPHTWGDGSKLGELINAPFADNSNKWAGGGLLTTPEDLTRFGLAHLRPGFLRAETLRMVFTPQRTTRGEELRRGLNWSIDKDSSGRLHYSHGGGSVGGTSILVIYPGEELVLAMQCNLTRAQYGRLSDEIAELFMTKRAAISSEDTR